MQTFQRHSDKVLVEYRFAFQPAAFAAEQQNSVLQDQDSLHTCVDRQLSWIYMERTCAIDVYDILYTGMQRLCSL